MNNRPLLVVLAFFIVIGMLVLVSGFTFPAATSYNLSTPSPPATVMGDVFSYLVPIVSQYPDIHMEFLPTILRLDTDGFGELGEVPFFSQADPRWIGTHINGDSEWWWTIGTKGCALTSAAMVFSYYGVDTNPKKLNQCMQDEALPFVWESGATKCSDDKVQFVKVMPFDWEKLDNQLNNKHRPVVLCMYMKSNPRNQHCMVTVSGSGIGRIGYYVHDPASSVGNIRMDKATSGWEFMYTIIYDNR
jgi:hypothetical protein